MKDFRRPSGQGINGANRNAGDRGGYGSHKGDFNAGERREIKHKATCSECNNTCEVPFRPNGSKPVYCKDCFGKKKGAQGNGNYEKREFTPRAYPTQNERPAAPAHDSRIGELAAQMDSIQSKLDRILKVMEGNKISEVKAEKVFEPKIVTKVSAAKKKVIIVAKKPVAKPTAKAKPVAKKKK